MLRATRKVESGSGLQISYERGFLEPGNSCRLRDLLWSELEWRQEQIVLFGREIAQPRLTAWYGDPDAHYSYSGLALSPRNWHPALLELRHRLERHLCHSFNSVLANAYRGGHDSMGWHSDDEPELGSDPVIASLSLGADRRFCFRQKGGGGQRYMALEDGSLLVMKSGCQRQWQHSLPKTKAPVGLRINLTFRRIISGPRSYRTG